MADVVPPVCAGSVPVETVVDVDCEAVAVAEAGGGFPLCGVTAADGDDGRLLPAAFVAATVKVYAVPSARPVTVAEVWPAATVVGTPPGLDVTV
jgi:hypothetical protein